MVSDNSGSNLNLIDSVDGLPDPTVTHDSLGGILILQTPGGTENMVAQFLLR